MMQLGFKLSSEEFGPRVLVDLAERAEAAGFDFALISDHFHPWTDAQGQSPFVWSVLGAIARATTRMRIGTAVTCPTIRMHPAIIAQAAATTASLMEGRFFLGLGTGENLNEHVVGHGWPSPDIRLAMLREAVAVLQLLWQGGMQSFHGEYFTVEDARLYSLPEQPPALMMAASKPGAAELAAETGDAMINTEIDADLVRAFERQGGAKKPRYVEMTTCWAKSVNQGRRVAHEIWGLAALDGMLFTELPTPALFESALKPVSPSAVAAAVVCGPDPQPYLQKIQQAERAGYTHVCLHQVGPEQLGFIDFCANELLPQFQRKTATGNGGARSPQSSAGKASPGRLRAAAR